MQEAIPQNSGWLDFPCDSHDFIVLICASLALPVPNRINDYLVADVGNL